VSLRLAKYTFLFYCISGPWWLKIVVMRPNAFKRLEIPLLGILLASTHARKRTNFLIKNPFFEE
jgi:hypothetical protein